MTVTINIPSQLPALTGNANLFLRVNAGANGIEWAATAGGGITIGTTAISSGTVGRVIFEGAGNVVQQDSAFVWNNTDKRLILGADQASVDTNPRLVVVGKNPSGTTTLAAFHNSTGNSNALVIKSDGFVGIKTASPLYDLHIQRGSGLSTPATLGITSESNASVHTLFELSNFSARAKTIVLTGTHGGVGQTNTQIIEHWVNSGGAAYGGNNRRLVIGTRANDGASADVPINFHIITSNSNSQFWTTAYQNLNGLIMSVRARGVGIFTDNVNNSAALDVVSTTKGFLPPRMTGAQAEAIATPAEGLMVYATNAGAGDITAKGWWGYDGTNWLQLN